jgi:hypothetical protein
MYQTYTWTEKFDSCLPASIFMPWVHRESLLDIQPWPDFEFYTEPVFEPYRFYFSSR